MPLAEAPLYLPFLEYPDVVHVGLEKLEPAHWIEPDNTFARYQQNKLGLLADLPDRVCLALPEAAPAEQELGRRLLAHLLNDHSAHYRHFADPAGGELLVLPEQQLHWALDPAQFTIRDSSLWVQDDLCLLQEIGGRYLLTAASLCAPSGWELQEKIGKPINEMHAPVPGLNQSIGKQIDHVLAKLSPLRPFQRFNWSVKTTDALALFPEDDEPQAPGGQPGLYLRVERQTLARLPSSQAIAFTIRVYTCPLESLVGIDGALAGLQRAVHGMSADEAKYKSMIALFPRLRAFFKRHR